MIILLAVFNSLFLPLELAFRPQFLDSRWMNIINRCIDAFFFIDIIVRFNTSYIHTMTGEEILSRKKIARNYIYGQFWIDLISSVPLDDFIFMFNPFAGEIMNKFLTNNIDIIRKNNSVIAYINQISSNEVKIISKFSFKKLIKNEFLGMSLFFY